MDSAIQFVSANLVFALLILGALAHVFFPRLCWYLHTGWQFKGESVEPSDAYLLVTRIFGILFIPVVVLFFHGFRSTDAFQGALSRIRNSPEAVQALGSPIKDGFAFTGSIENSGDSGRASFEIPVSGPKGAGNVHVTAMKSMGEWRYPRLLLVMKDSNKRITLFEPETSGEPSAKWTDAQAHPSPSPSPQPKVPELERLLSKAQTQYEALAKERENLDANNQEAVKAFNVKAAAYQKLLVSIEQRRNEGKLPGK